MMTQEEYINAKKLDDYLQDRKTPTEWELRLFLHEANFCCPLCGKMLQTKSQLKPDEKQFQIAHIYPNSPTKKQYETLYGLERLGSNSEDFDNRIALCRNCHATQDFHTTTQEYLKLVDIKKHLLKSAALQNISQSLSLENEISTIIKKTRDVTEEELAKLNYKPINIANKFEQNEFILKTKVAGYVSSYFTFIRDEFKSIDGTGHFVFDVLCQQIRSCFLKMETETKDKTLIFNHMVTWIKNRTQSNSIEACEAVISYFVQQCEVFNEITK